MQACSCARPIPAPGAADPSHAARKRGQQADAPAAALLCNAFPLHTSAQHKIEVRQSNTATRLATQLAGPHPPRYFGNSVANELSSSMPEGLSSFLKGSTFQWSMPSWSHGLGLRCCTQQHAERGVGTPQAAAGGGGSGGGGPTRALAASPRSQHPSAHHPATRLLLLADRALVRMLLGGALAGACHLCILPGHR